MQCRLFSLKILSRSMLYTLLLLSLEVLIKAIFKWFPAISFLLVFCSKARKLEFGEKVAPEELGVLCWSYVALLSGLSFAAC